MSSVRCVPRAMIAALCLVLSAACGGDKSTGPRAEPPISQAEAEQIASAVFEELSEAFDNIEFARLSPSNISDRMSAAGVAASRMPTETKSFSGNCRLGGRIAGSATLTHDVNDAGTGNMSFDMTVAPSGCRVSTGLKTIAVDGDPALRFQFGMRFRDGELVGNITFSLGGGFKWDGGRCGMDYIITIAPDGSGTLRGTVCGHSVSEDL